MNVKCLTFILLFTFHFSLFAALNSELRTLNSLNSLFAAPNSELRTLNSLNSLFAAPNSELRTLNSLNSLFAAPNSELRTLNSLNSLFAAPNSELQTLNLLKKAGDNKKYPDNQLLLIYDSTNVNVNESGLSYFVTHKLYKVLSHKGALDLSVVKYGYDPLTAYADIKKVVIYRKDGKVENIDLKNILDYPAPARGIYWGAREKMLEVGRLEPGDGLEVVLYKKGFSYALLGADDDSKYVPPMKGQFYDIVPFWSDDATHTLIINKVYRIKLPTDKRLHYKFYHGDVETKETKTGNVQIFTFTKKDIKPFEKEANMVSLYDVAPKLLLSTTESWREKSKWFYKVNENFGSFESTPGIKNLVSKILKGAKNQMDSVTILTHWAGDQIRYSGLTMGNGEGFTLHKGSMTFRDRCGVCKDKAGMLITLLRAAGFKSYPAMTMAGSKIDEIAADHFNHCVVSVRLKDGKLHMLDPTWVPFRRELWSSAEQQQNYLIGTPEGEPLNETPLSPPENHYVKIINNSELSADGTLNGEFEITAEGQSDGAVRSIFTYFFRSQWNDNVAKEILDVYPLAKVVSVIYDAPWDYLSKPVRVKIKYSIPDYAVITDKEIIVKPLCTSNLLIRAQAHLTTDTSMINRKYAFRDRCSRLVEITDNMKLPAYKEAYYVPASQSLTGHSASFKGGYAIKNQNLKFEEKVVLNKRVYETTDWTDYRKAEVSELKMNKEKLILNK